MRLLKDQEIRAVRLGDYRGRVFLDGEELNDVVEVGRSGDKVGITTLVRDHGNLMLDPEHNTVLRETRTVEVDRVRWEDSV